MFLRKKSTYKSCDKVGCPNKQTIKKRDGQEPTKTLHNTTDSPVLVTKTICREKNISARYHHDDDAADYRKTQT